MQEFALIHRLTKDLPANPAVIVGPGDDCAVLDIGLPDRWLLFKTDAVVEGVHFLPDTEPERLGHKALARPLSDIAAMAGQPTSAVVTLGLPPGFAVHRVDAVYAGLRRLADRHGVALVGGETTTNPGGWILSLAVVGTAPKDRCLRRAGARPGDALFVTGTLGGSAAGKHLDFEPRLAEARWLAQRFAVHAMIDLSDGLAGDLPHLLAPDNLGAELLARAIPISRDARTRSRSGPHPKSPLLAALSDGEDFELLFALPPSQAVPLLDAWKPAFPSLPLSCIGTVTADPGIRLRDRHATRPLEAHGYVHFT
ncbi:MAG TPA: thiamine-phosphate kinase [Verrucomicrobiota bacterium]|nr:thiamine-phosphate kinase [Verrucomicrobiota bacterium]HNU50918.1 thiamine-phosphate kinase [Verrucomicrobiota bacterium]